MTRHSLGVLMAMVAGAAACGRGKPAIPATPSDVTDVPATQDVPRPSITPDAEPAYGWTGPGGRPFSVTIRTGSGDDLSRQIGRKTFTLALRVPARGLTQYPCTSCHDGPKLASVPAVRPHENIQPVHPSVTHGACTTCHAAGAVDHLQLANGDRATLNQPYRLCVQCHFRQVEAWAGGGHGKRLDGWAGKRVVMNCTDCHDPHDPRAKSRIPFPGATLPGSPGGNHER